MQSAAMVCLILFLAGTSLFSSEGSEVRFVTYNVYNYHVEKGRTSSDQAAPPKAKDSDSRKSVASILAELKPDVIVLQEMGSLEALEDLRTRLEEEGLAFPNRRFLQGPDEERCLAILSRLPFQADFSDGFVPLEIHGRAHMASRGVLEVDLLLPDGQLLTVFGLHLKSQRETPGIDQARFRAAEAREVRRRIDRAFERSGSGWLIVLGDLNDSIQSITLRTLLGGQETENRLTALRPLDSRGESWTHYWAESDLYSRIDYLLVSKELGQRTNLEIQRIYDGADWRLASDHRALFAMFLLESTQEAPKVANP